MCLLHFRHVDDIDLFPAGIAEYRVEGAIVGPVFSCILAQQFRNLRKGDRFWYENGGHKGAFTPVQLEEIRKGSLARLFCDNFNNVLSIQLRPMEVPHGRVDCADPFLHIVDLGAWREFGPYPEPSYILAVPPLPPPHSIFEPPIHFPDSPSHVQVFQQLITRRKSSDKTQKQSKSRTDTSLFNDFDDFFSSIEKFDKEYD
uniref:Peroxidase n=1 Tax=Strigamia maritima TaxID=126957 RepID=T1JID4_STRMM